MDIFVIAPMSDEQRDAARWCHTALSSTVPGMSGAVPFFSSAGGKQDKDNNKNNKVPPPPQRRELYSPTPKKKNDEKNSRTHWAHTTHPRTRGNRRKMISRGVVLGGFGEWTNFVVYCSQPLHTTNVR